MSELPPGFVLDHTDAAVPAGFVLDQSGGSSLGGIAKSLGSGLAEGAIGMAGLSGDLYHLGLRALGDNLTPESNYGSAALQKKIEGVTGDFYKPQGTPEDIASKIGQFAPALIGGPETLATKALTRVVAPAVASEAGGAIGGPLGEVAGALIGAGGASAAAQKFKAMAAARAAAAGAPTALETKAASRLLYQHPDVAAVQIKPDALSGLADTIENDLKYGPNSGYRPANEKQVFDAVNELRTPNAAAPIGLPAAPISAPVSTPAGKPAPSASSSANAAPEQPSLLQFIASKGGLGPDAELEAIGAHGHTVNVDGVGRRKLVRQGGWPLDYAREAAEEAGYLRGDHSGTSTVNDLLDAMDAEMRGQKRYPEGFEGHVGKREAAAMSERERAEYDRHMHGFESDLADAGHGGLGPDVKARAVHLMANEGMDADTAVDHALHQLEQEDTAAQHGVGFPGDRPAVAAEAGKPANVQRAATVADLDNVRQVLGNAAKEKDAIGQPTRQAAAAARAIDHINNFLPNLKQPDLIAGDAQKASAILDNARKNWAVYKKSSQVQTLRANAELNAASANSGANIGNATRQAFKPLLKNDAAKAIGYTADEKAALNRIVRGTWTGAATRIAGNILGGGGGLGMLAGGAAGYESGGVPGALAAGATGIALKKISNRSTFNAVQKLDTLIRSRSPEALRLAAQNPQIASVLPPKSIQALRALILADPTLAQVSNGMSGADNRQRQSIGQAGP